MLIHHFCVPALESPGERAQGTQWPQLTKNRTNEGVYYPQNLLPENHFQTWTTALAAELFDGVHIS